MYGSAIATAFRILWRMLERRGIEPAPLFRAAGLDPGQLSNPRARYPGKQARLAWMRVSEMVDDPGFGLTIAEVWQPTDFHALGFAFLASTTLRNALNRLVRYHAVVDNVVSYSIAERDDRAILSCRTENGGLDEPPILEDARWVVVLDACQRVYGVDLDPLEVAFLHSDPGAAMGKFFGVSTMIGGQIFPSPPATPDLLSSNSKFEFIAAVAATGETRTDTCVVSGAVTVSSSPWNVPSPLSEGDRFDLVFDTCDDGDGYTLDGSFSLSVRGLDDDARTDVFRFRYELLNMTLIVTSGVDNHATLSAPYLFVLDWDSLDFPVVVLTASPNLRLGTQADDYSSNLGGWHSLTVNAGISIPATLGEARSLMKSAVIGDYISCDIIVPLQAPDGQDPESGEILVSGGDGNGTVCIVIESSARVRLEIDTDGDGIVDDFQYTTWAALKEQETVRLSNGQEILSPWRSRAFIYDMQLCDCLHEVSIERHHLALQEIISCHHKNIDNHLVTAHSLPNRQISRLLYTNQQKAGAGPDRGYGVSAWMSG